MKFKWKMNTSLRNTKTLEGNSWKRLIRNTTTVCKCQTRMTESHTTNTKRCFSISIMMLHGKSTMRLTRTTTQNKLLISTALRWWMPKLSPSRKSMIWVNKSEMTLKIRSESTRETRHWLLMKSYALFAERITWFKSKTKWTEELLSRTPSWKQ